MSTPEKNMFKMYFILNHADDNSNWNSGTVAKDPTLWRQARESNIEGQWVDKIVYLILLSVLHQWGLLAEVGALGSALVLPPDWATWFVSDTLNLSGVARHRVMADEQGKGPIVMLTQW